MYWGSCSLTLSPVHLIAVLLHPLQVLAYLLQELLRVLEKKRG
jgi:hypothetical protein